MTRVVVIMLAITMLATTAAAAAGPKVGVALSGGGARGFAHIGVLKVLEEVGMPIDVVTGTSIGSVMGGLYAAGYSAAELEQIALSQDWLLMIVQPPKRDEMNFIRKRWDQLYLVSLMLDGYKVQLPSGLRSGQELLDFLTLLTVNVHETHDFSELPIPYSCVALDIVTGEAVVLDSGSLPDAMRASMSIQSVFTPMELDGRLLVDGGMARNMPAVDALNLGADIVVGVDVSVDPMHAEDLGSLLNVATQMVLLTITENTREQSALCRTVLRPELGDMSIMDFGKIQETIDAGEAVARASIDELRALADSVIALAGPAVRPIRKEPAPVTVSGIDVEGLDMVSDHVARAELRLEPPVTATAQEIEEGITRLYHTDSFDMVRWRLDGPDDDARLRIKVTEKHENRFRFGVRFDSDIRAAVLLNVTFRNLIWRSSVLQFDLKLGDNNGVAASYVTHTGLFSALGLFASAGISQLKFDFYDDGVKIARYNANVYSARLFFGTLYSNWINLGVGGAIEQSRLEPDVGTPEFGDSTETIVPVVARLTIDTTNETIYPTSGILFDAFGAAGSEDVGSDMTFARLYLDWRLVLPVGGRFSLLQNLYVGSSWQDLPVTYHYFLGGINRPWTFRGRSNSFLGVPSDGLVGPHAQEVMLGIQWQVIRMLFIQARWNAGNTFEEWSVDLQNNRYINGGGILFGARLLNARAEISFATSELDDFTAHFTLGNDF